jgi:cytochrome P450
MGPLTTTQVQRIEDLPLLTELDAPEFGLDLTWVADDLFTRPYQGLMRASDGSAVVYRNADMRALMNDEHVTHQTLDSMATYWRATCPVEPEGLTRFFDEATFSHRQPDHLPLKQLSSRRLTTKSVARLESAAAAAIEERIELVGDGSEIDFMHDFAKPVIGQFWRRALGLTPEEGQRLVDLVTDFQLSSLLAPDANQILRASDGASEYVELFTAGLERSVRAGGHELLRELVSDFASMPTLGKPGNACEAFAITLVDGFHTFGSAMSGVMHALLSNPDALARVRGDQALAGAAFLEGIRLHGAVILTAREAIGDFEYGGVAIPDGTALLMMWLFANRDPEVFPDPNAYRLDRQNHLKQTPFGGGVYMCPGRNVVRMLGETAVRLLTRPAIEIVPTGDVSWAPQSSIHELVSMPVAIRRH